MYLFSVSKETDTAVKNAAVSAKRNKTDRIAKAKAENKPMQKVKLNNLIQKHECCNTKIGNF
jgi:hypothetical protein